MYLNVMKREINDKPILLRAGDIAAIVMGAAFVVAALFFWLMQKKKSRF